MAALFKFTPEQLQTKINQYFEEVENTFLVKWDVVKTGDRAGQPLKINIPKMPSVQGLAVFLDISREEFYHWMRPEIQQKNKKLSDIAIRAKEKIEALQINGAGAGLYQPMIVSRLNHLKDEVETTSANIDATGKSEEEIRAAIQAIEAARKK